MNIFIMILVAVFMMGYYLMDSPSQKIEKHTTEYSIIQSDMRGIAQCATAAHNAQLHDMMFEDVCVEQNNIITVNICLDDAHKIINCDKNKSKKKISHYLVTATGTIDSSKYDEIMNILETYFTENSSFGLFQEGAIMSGGTSTPRSIPSAIIEEIELTDGQLVYITQYEPADIPTESTSGIPVDIVCPTGTAKTFRFGRWQCVGVNTKTDCGGDLIWDSDLRECVADESRRPLCTGAQTAVMVDDVWECISPFPEKKCPDNMIARLNYNTFEWECVTDPQNTADAKKCDGATTGYKYGTLGTTLRIPQTSCTDCERMVTDPETCVSVCVPDPSKINDKNCYPGDIMECTGSARAIYFGFPNAKYLQNISDMIDVSPAFDKKHSQNRKFNCLDCGAGYIDAEKSQPPYTAVCK